MRQVADCLDELGLGQYAQCFANNDIDFTILRELTDQDLETIGVHSLGHRRKMLKSDCRAWRNCARRTRERHYS
jgi:hypothetical protein